jgi:uncharacterized protein YecE (DUF72 family)
MTRIGTAGWAIASRYAPLFPTAGSSLQRYSARFNAAEINSTFYRSHRSSTFERWAAAVPADFRFSVKLPKAITHERRLSEAEDLLSRFLEEVSHLGPKLGPLLVQLPPSFAFDARAFGRFLERLRMTFVGPVACEPRHPTWFTDEGAAALAAFGVARVGADPPPATGADAPAGDRALRYYRLHGSPQMYYSEYDQAALEALAATLSNDIGGEAWCIFDNTVTAAALGNAATLSMLTRGEHQVPSGRASSRTQPLLTSDPEQPLDRPMRLPRRTWGRRAARPRRRP